jgi:quinoprotein glucose dehydrogenase
MRKARSLLFPAVVCGLAATLILYSSSKGQNKTADKGYVPRIAAASKAAQEAIKRFRLPEGLAATLFAAEPMLANPVCFCVDEKNRIFVAETFRLHDGVTDIRGHMDWLDDDLASRTVADRVDMLHKRLGKKVHTYGVHHDRIRLLEDTRGAGKADRSTVFADGFHHIPEGLGAGLLARRGKVWYTCIPDLWLLEDTTGKDRADARKSLHHGYGVHVGFIGHDLHGLRMGPDGKLYFSIGDRGFHVKTKEGTVPCPDSGAVLRCNPDGSELEIVATGLRNPQELAFDKYGNLFTGDNNADGGDQARWVYVVDGGDSGWRIGYQFMHYPRFLGPWNAEKMWHPQWDGQAAYLVPPIANVASGPAGLTYNPGTALLPRRYDDHFFLCDFRGAGGQSGVRSFAVKPKGASFELVDQHEFFWGVLATDVDFGMDGALYVSDWVDGWNKPHKGRIYKVQDPKRARDAAALGVKKLMAEGVAKRSTVELVNLLEHADMRVRQEAQFALAEKGADGIAALSKVAREGKNQLARLHAVWGLGQVARKVPRAFQPLSALLADEDAEVRAQAAKVLGEGRVAAAHDKLIPLLKDAEPRVRFFAALALSKMVRKETLPGILRMLDRNADRDPYLRHAGVMALTRLKDEKALLAAAREAAVSVRLAVLLALRRLGSPEVARFLTDAEPKLVVEAARAINDVPIPKELPKLAALGTRGGLAEPLLYRVLNAHFRLGKKENAAAVAALAARTDVPEGVRVQALRDLGEWARPSGRDKLVGLWRPLEPRSGEEATAALRANLGGVFTGPDMVRREGARLAARLGMKEVGPVLFELAGDRKKPAALRVETLLALAALKDSRLVKAIEVALADPDARLRTEGRRLLAGRDPVKAIALLEQALEKGAVVERQGAFATLAGMKTPAAEALLSRWLDRLLAGQVAAEVRLDLLEAAARRSSADIKKKLARYEAARPKNDPLAKYREALVGGDAEAGRKIFYERAAVSCLRCHKVKGEGGDVGPDLTGIGTRQKRDYLLESIVDPNRQIAKGYETVVLTLKNGKFVTGVLKAEDGKQVRLMTAEGTLVTVAKARISERNRGPSAMPSDLLKHLSKADLRDLVEFLANLKEKG